jgi:hypothetical protein
MGEEGMIYESVKRHKLHDKYENEIDILLNGTTEQKGE